MELRKTYTTGSPWDSKVGTRATSDCQVLGANTSPASSKDTVSRYVLPRVLTIPTSFSLTLLGPPKDGGFKNTRVRMDSAAWWTSECSVSRDWPAEGCIGARNRADKWTKQTNLKGVKNIRQENEGLTERERHPSAGRHPSRRDVYLCVHLHTRACV